MVFAEGAPAKFSGRVDQHILVAISCQDIWVNMLLLQRFTVGSSEESFTVTFVVTLVCRAL